MLESNTEEYQYQTHIKNAVVMQELEETPDEFQSTAINQEVDEVYKKSKVFDKISEMFDGKYELSDFNTEDIKLIKGYIKDVNN